jgi:3-oxoadipate enol-lactonase
MKQLRTSDGQVIAYREDGVADGTPIALANSLGTDLRLWDLQLAVLATSHRIVRFDMRGHGRSSVPDGEYTLERLALDALELFEELRIDRLAFCGVSLGGMVGQWLGVHARSRLSKLILCNTSAYLGPRQAWDERIARVRAGGMAAVSGAVIERWFTPGYREAGGSAVSIARDMLLTTAPVGYAGCCTAIRDMDLRHSVAAIAVPTLVVGGLLDPATPPEHAEHLVANISGACLAMLPAAHLSNLEQPDAFNRVLVDFLCGQILG